MRSTPKFVGVGRLFNVKSYALVSVHQIILKGWYRDDIKPDHNGRYGNLSA